jgi:rare lipoprotein A
VIATYLVAITPWSPLITEQDLDGGANMYSITCDNPSRVGIGASRIPPDKPGVSPAAVWRALQLFAVALTAAMLAACAQSSVVTDKPTSLATSLRAPPEPNRKASFVRNAHAAVATNNHAPFATDKHAAETQYASYGLASFYGHDSETASGERFNAGELTAAHRTLPFGTRVRVTNVATGRSVTVRVNDRGPFVPGRVVDVSYSAAETLGIIGRGVAKVKLDVVQ